ncbi:MAG: CapA family protein [Gemmatimonadetes bacterium]|nr:MAG: CapA family protein [Gemmatimonadota bacterium]
MRYFLLFLRFFVTLVIVFFHLQMPVLAAENSVTVMYTGDVMLGGRLISIMDEKGFAYPFQETQALLDSADLVICNLEAPFSANGTPFPKDYHFRVPPQYAQALKIAGFDVLAIANDHILDYGESSLRTTQESLTALGLKTLGAGDNVVDARTPLVVEIHGVKIGLLAYSKSFPTSFYATEDRYGTAPGFEQFLREDIPALRDSVDFLLVSFHWGTSQRKYPKRYQRHLAHLSIDLGADAVVGHHSYHLQPIEAYNGGVIVYNIGKYVAGSLVRASRMGALIRFQIRQEGRHTLEVIPIHPGEYQYYFQPIIATGDKALDILEYIQHQSINLPFQMDRGRAIYHFGSRQIRANSPASKVMRSD